MDGKNQDSRYLMMWTGVIITAAIVFVGWVWLVRHNINQINAEMNQKTGTMDQVTAEMQKMFDETSAILQRNEKSLTVPENPAPAVDADSAGTAAK